MKGRNPRLIEQRNQYLIKRFYYWYEVKRLRRDDAISQISNFEVFLAEESVFRIIRNNASLLKEIKQKRPSEKQLDGFVFSGMPVQAAQQALSLA